jgi:hypothetical protein
MRVNHTYHRRGAVAYLAAYDVHQAKVFGRTEQRTGTDPFRALVAQVMNTGSAGVDPGGDVSAGRGRGPRA